MLCHQWHSYARLVGMAGSVLPAGIELVLVLYLILLLGCSVMGVLACLLLLPWLLLPWLPEGVRIRVVHTLARAQGVRRGGSGIWGQGW